MSLTPLAAAWLLAAEPVFGNPPRSPGPESWTFEKEMSEQELFPAPDVASSGREPWLKERISRCFFGPVKRAPHFRDELMDDVDYYPEEYLKRLRREGVNGLWLTVRFDELAPALDGTEPPCAERRFAKLRRTVEKCGRFGIKTWLFAIEPTYRTRKDSAIVARHPEWFGPVVRGDYRVMCSSAPEVREYLERSAFEIFSKAPDLGGLIVLSHGECPSSCLSSVYPVFGGKVACPRCGRLEPWQIHLNTMGAILKGVRRACPQARVFSWLYHPQADPVRGAWVLELARHLPEGMVLQYNFESGVEAVQEGKTRCGGDYWLSEPGPGAPFRAVAAAVAESGGSGVSAKIQTCNSHELATLPYIPVPGLLYRKFKAMRENGVSSAMLCWYFGGHPGVMNRAAGELARSDFGETEDEFLLRLARPQWGDQAKKVAGIWKSFSDGYSNYPLDNSMQYYGPFHSGVVWPLWADVNLLPLVETWQPDRPACGDMIGECLGSFSLADALALAGRMKEGFGVPVDIDVPNRERAKDVAVMKAAAILFRSGADILGFYRARARAIYLSRVRRDSGAAAECVEEMLAAAGRAKACTGEMIRLCEADSLIGFHSEAERHQFHPASLRWRLGTLDATCRRLEEILAGLRGGGEYPESDFERNAPRAVVGGGEVAGRDLAWRAETDGAGNLTVKGRVSGALGRFSVAVTDAAGTVNAKIRTPEISPDGTFEIIYPASEWSAAAHERPGWILFQTNFGSGVPLWPASDKRSYGRLNIGAVWGRTFGRLVWPQAAPGE